MQFPQRITRYNPSPQTHSTGAAVTVADTTNTLAVDPTSAIANLAITLPTLAYSQGVVVRIKFGGQLSYPNNVVTSLTISTAAGATLDNAGLTPVSAIAGDFLGYMLIGTTWTRII